MSSAFSNLSAPVVIKPSNEATWTAQLPNNFDARSRLRLTSANRRCFFFFLHFIKEIVAMPAAIVGTGSRQLSSISTRHPVNGHDSKLSLARYVVYRNTKKKNLHPVGGLFDNFIINWHFQQALRGLLHLNKNASAGSSRHSSSTRWLKTPSEIP